MAKARNGQGTIKPRKLVDGTVVYDAWASVRDPVTGKTSRPSKRGLPSETAAVEWVQAQRASKVRASGMALDDLAEVYWSSGSVEVSTLPNWQRMYETDIQPYLGKLPISNLLPMHIDMWVQKVREKPSLRTGTQRKPNSLVNYLIVLSAILEYGVVNRFIDADWTKSSPGAIRLRKEAVRHEPEEKTPWTVQDFMDFLEVEDEPSYRAMWCLMAATGVRRGHACGLLWEEVDRTDRKRIVFGTNRVYTAGGVKITKAKGGRKIIVPIDELLIGVLDEQERRQTQLKEEGQWEDHGVVFDRPFIYKTRKQQLLLPGQPMDPSGVTARFKRLVKRANLPHGSPHTLRHTWATLAREAGASREAVGDILGHGSSTVTKIYDHSETEQTELSKVMSKMVLPPQ